MTAQRPLPLRVRARRDLGSFLAPAGAPALRRARDAVLRRVEAGKALPLYLHGPAQCGKSHLLLGACEAVSARGAGAHYLPLGNLTDAPAGLFEGLEEAALLALDDLECVAGDAGRELALFDLYDRARSAGTALLFAARVPPRDLGLVRPELASRLAWGEVCPMTTLPEPARAEVLAQRARQLGLELPDAVMQYLLTHSPRALGDLLGALDRLDRAALATQRRITVPLVRVVLGDDPDAW